MAPIPLIGRLHMYEYLALAASFILLFLESVVRAITLLLPTPIIRFLYHISRNAFNSLSSPYSRRARNRKKNVSHPIAQAQDFVELCELFGYHAEEHVVQTRDGYLLGLHRLAYRRGEEDQRVNTDANGSGCVRKKVVYLHHGLMMNSEVWVCLTEKERCLPFTLVEQGYDVWLGNNRGNKYSKKSIHHAPTQVEFWNFSMDQFAFHDIPDSIQYVLETTNQPSLSYIGFSQGTAQAFATLSIHPMLNNKVDVFVALAPAMAPPGLASGIVSSLVKSNPQVLFLAFGRRVMMASSTMWQAIMYPAIFVYCIDTSLSFLFGWKAQNISPHQKLAAYPHLFSFTSVKSVVHWFQIIRNGTFQMYDDEVTAPFSIGNGSKYYKVAKFPTRNIKTPIVLVYGGSDSLVDINLMLKELPRHTIAKCVPKYEHLDLLWAHDIDRLVFPHVLEALENYAMPGQTKQAALGWQKVQRGILERSSLASMEDSVTSSLAPPPGYSEDEVRAIGTFGQSPGIISERPGLQRHHTIDFAADEALDETDVEDEDDPPLASASTLPVTDSRSVRSPQSGVPGPTPLTDINGGTMRRSNNQGSFPEGSLDGGRASLLTRMFTAQEEMNAINAALKADPWFKQWLDGTAESPGISAAVQSAASRGNNTVSQTAQNLRSATGSDGESAQSGERSNTVRLNSTRAPDPPEISSCQPESSHQDQYIMRAGGLEQSPLPLHPTSHSPSTSVIGPTVPDTDEVESPPTTALEDDPFTSPRSWESGRTVRPSMHHPEGWWSSSSAASTVESLIDGGVKTGGSVRHEAD